MRGERSSQLRKKIRENVPAQSGVYRFLDKYGTTIYIGKSINLRNRMLSYFYSNSRGLEPLLQRMVCQVDSFQFSTTASELEALILEDHLIKSHLPEFNQRQKNFIDYHYIGIQEDKIPCLTLISHPSENGLKRTFGPFRDGYFVQDLIDFLNTTFRLKSCEDANPNKICMQFQLDRCSGPCENFISEQEYRLNIEKAIGFLEGSTESITGRIETAMQAASRRLDFEKAADLKHWLQFCKNYAERRRFILQFQNGELVVHENSSPPLLHLFNRGAYICMPAAAANANDLPLEILNNQTVFLIDRANIVFSWLKKNKTMCRFSFSPPPAT